MKHILLIATGGTIASAPSEHGLMPSIDVNRLLSYIPEIGSFCHLEGVSIMHIDSTNMTPHLMGVIARTIKEQYDKYDGFVISHGTDTMAYSAAAMSYMTKNSAKPIVFTGSQLPIEDPSTDAKQNLVDAMHFACNGPSGVYIVFHGIAINGTRATKQKSKSFDAFQSINFPVIASIKSGEITYHIPRDHPDFQNIFHPNLSDDFSVDSNLCPDVLILKISPGMKPEIFDFIKEHYKGVVLESFGLGGIPNTDPDIISKIHELTKNNVCVAITTQCLEEGIDLRVYEVGQMLARQNVILSKDMTTEALTMKLMWALAHFDNPLKIKSYIETPYAFDRKD